MSHTHQVSKRCDVCRIVWSQCRCIETKIEQIERCDQCVWRHGRAPVEIKESDLKEALRRTVDALEHIYVTLGLFPGAVSALQNANRVLGLKQKGGA